MGGMSRPNMVPQWGRLGKAAPACTPRRARGQRTLRLAADMVFRLVGEGAWRQRFFARRRFIGSGHLVRSPHALGVLNHALRSMDAEHQHARHAGAASGKFAKEHSQSATWIIAKTQQPSRPTNFSATLLTARPGSRIEQLPSTKSELTSKLDTSSRLA